MCVRRKITNTCLNQLFHQKHKLISEAIRQKAIAGENYQKDIIHKIMKNIPSPIELSSHSIGMQTNAEQKNNVDISLENVSAAKQDAGTYEEHELAVITATP